MAHLLIIEPDPSVRELMVMFANGAGHATTAPDLNTQLPQWERFDALVVEPSCAQGRLLLQQVVDAGSTLPVVCVSICPREMSDAPVAGFPYVVKPFTRSELLGVVNGALHLTGAKGAWL